MFLTSFRRRLSRSVKKRGVLRTVSAAAAQIPAVMKAPRVRGGLVAKDSFDAAYAIDTAGVVELSDLEIDSPNEIHGVHYQPTPVELFRRIMAGLDIPYEQFTFIDIGSGKGRVLLLASELPFREIIGIEFSPELNAIARQNVRTYSAAVPGSCRIQTICADACDFPLPEMNTVLYFYNPFEEPVMRRFLDRLRDSLAAHPRLAYIVYCHPLERHLFEDGSRFERVKMTAEYDVYRALPPVRE